MGIFNAVVRIVYGSNQGVLRDTPRVTYIDKLGRQVVYVDDIPVHKRSIQKTLCLRPESSAGNGAVGGSANTVSPVYHAKDARVYCTEATSVLYQSHKCVAVTGTDDTSVPTSQQVYQTHKCTVLESQAQCTEVTNVQHPDHTSAPESLARNASVPKPQVHRSR